MKQPSFDERVEALRRIQSEAECGRYQAGRRLNTIDALLFLPDDFYESDLSRILNKARYPPKIARSIELYVMMARLTQLCEPRGSATGPACGVTLIDFENLTRDGVIDVKGLAGFRLFFSLPNSTNKLHPVFERGKIVNWIAPPQKSTQLLIESSPDHEINLRWYTLSPGSKFNALDYLSPDQRDLYYKAKPFFVGKKRPTLKSLAANLLKEDECDEYSDRSVTRYVEALRDFKFANDDIRRVLVIQTVKMFGIDKRSVRQMHAEFCPELISSVQRAVTFLNPLLSQVTALLTVIADRLSAISAKPAKSSTDFGRV